MSTSHTPLLFPPLFNELANIVATRGMKYLVETGTGPLSSGMEAAKKLGLHGYTCDVYEPCIHRVRAIYPEFGAYHSDSIAMLREICPTLNAPTFFWLDGHCPTDKDCLPAGIFPLYEEMVLIRDTKPGIENDVLWLDDIAMITDPANPLASKWDVDLAGTRWYGETGNTWEEFLAVFAETHDWEIDRHQCLLKLTPKAWQ